jgi:hypothetical protein
LVSEQQADPLLQPMRRSETVILIHYRRMSMTTENRSHPIKRQNTDEITSQLHQMLKEIRFGSIEITIHDSRVVQIERREKIRPDVAKA